MDAYRRVDYLELRHNNDDITILRLRKGTRLCDVLEVLPLSQPDPYASLVIDTYGEQQKLRDSLPRFREAFVGAEEAFDVNAQVASVKRVYTAYAVCHFGDNLAILSRPKEMGAGFSTMAPKWQAFGVIGIIATVMFGLNVLGLLIAAIVAGIAGAVVESKSKK